jgi:Tfp pilus assembly protein PilF
MMNYSKLFGLVTLALLGLNVPVLAQQKANEAELEFAAGLSHLREGRAGQAIEAFKEAVKRDPKSPYAQKGLGVAYMLQQRYPQAIDCFRKALEMNPYYVDVRNDLGTALMLAGKYDEARRQLTQAYEEPTNPTPEMTAYNIGQSFLKQKDYEKALDWFKTSTQRNNRYVLAQLSAADVYASTNRMNEAIAQLEAALATNPNDPLVILAAGEAYYRVGRFVEARAKLEQVAKQDPTGPSGRRAVDFLHNFPK